MPDSTQLTTSPARVEQPKPHRPISLYVTPPLDIDDGGKNRHNDADDDDEEDEEDDVMDKQSYQLSQLQFTPPSSLNNGKFIHMPPPITPPLSTDASPNLSGSPFKYHQPPSKKTLLAQGYSPSESLLLSPSKLFKRLSRKFSTSSSNSSKRNSQIIPNGIPKSESTSTLKPTLELPTKQPPPPLRPQSLNTSASLPNGQPPYLRTTPAEKTTPKKNARPVSVSLMFSPKGMVSRVKVSKSQPGKTIETPDLRPPPPQESPLRHKEQKSHEDAHDTTTTSIHDITSFSGFSLDRNVSTSNSNIAESPQKSTFSHNTTASTRATHESPDSRSPFYSPSPATSNKINNDPISSAPIDVTRSSTKKSTTSRVSRRQSTTHKSSSGSELALVLRIFMKDPDSQEITSITIKLRKDKLNNINELTNLVLFKLMSKKQDLNINRVKLLIIFKDKSLKPILLKDSIDKKSKSMDGIVNKELGVDKDDLLLDYVQMKDKLYIKALV
ncbi:hypothetical protein Cantr_05474 [Candida viswanathii]|uniref:Uncharacterized protein n=1 Tax=Candida viswanathii TaxID=5486 RepID=A0A367XTI3_9ASCO|nr:hypothetical protein Cantr_05474 [Candida viswanathii]